jgi:phage shock protein E
MSIGLGYFCFRNLILVTQILKLEKLLKNTIMGLLSMLGLGGKTESVKEFMDKGAVIIDVRTIGEYREGHIKGSKNIPLDMIFSKVNEIKRMEKPVIVCCRSGMRSGQAASILKNSGIEAMNGGGWQSLENKL